MKCAFAALATSNESFHNLTKKIDKITKKIKVSVTYSKTPKALIKRNGDEGGFFKDMALKEFKDKYSNSTKK